MRQQTGENRSTLPENWVGGGAAGHGNAAAVRSLCVNKYKQ